MNKFLKWILPIGLVMLVAKASAQAADTGGTGSGNKPDYKPLLDLSKLPTLYIEDFDKDWDYLVEKGQWFARRKGTGSETNGGNWKNLKNSLSAEKYNEAAYKLDSFLLGQSNYIEKYKLY